MQKHILRATWSWWVQNIIYIQLENIKQCCLMIVRGKYVEKQTITQCYPSQDCGWVWGWDWKEGGMWNTLFARARIWNLVAFALTLQSSPSLGLRPTPWVPGAEGSWTQAPASVWEPAPDWDRLLHSVTALTRCPSQQVRGSSGTRLNGPGSSWVTLSRLLPSPFEI